jgi:hypothetical protein
MTRYPRLETSDSFHESRVVQTLQATIRRVMEIQDHRAAGKDTQRLTIDAPISVRSTTHRTWGVSADAS